MFAFLMGLKSIAPAALQQLMASGEVRVIDVNAPAVWAKFHVPGASNLDPAQFNASDLPEDRACLLVFYCSNPLCRKAPNAAKRAKSMGYHHVKVMSAGINGWMDAGLPVVSQ